MKSSWMGMGFSVHSVPSLSKTAMRSFGGTKPGSPSRVAAATKSRIVRVVAVSRHDARPVSVVELIAVGGHRPEHEAVGDERHDRPDRIRTGRKEAQEDAGDGEHAAQPLPGEAPGED